MPSSAGRIDDGFSTTITIEDFPAIKLWEKTVTPPAISGGGAIETTTMRNAFWRTRSEKQLKTLNELTLTAAYDPQVIEDLMNLINVRKNYFVNFADGSVLVFPAFMDEFAPSECAEGEQPTADITIIPTMEDANYDEAELLFTDN